MFFSDVTRRQKTEFLVIKKCSEKRSEGKQRWKCERKRLFKLRSLKIFTSEDP